MTGDEIEQATDAACKQVDDSPAMDSSRASQADSVEYLQGVRSHCDTWIETITGEMNRG